MDVLWSKDIDQWCSRDINQEFDGIPFDLTSNEDDKSSSYRSGSVVSRNTTKSQQRSSTNLSVMSQSDGSSYSRFSQNEQVPSAQSEGRILDLLAGSGYPMTQVNGQRKLGPPPGWTKPPPEPECEIFVGKIPRDLHEDTLYPIFSGVGEIYEIRLMMDFSGTNRGYCFVMFTKVEYAERAIRELNNWEIRRGHKIGVVASINNCRLCIGQLPVNIKSEIVITTFHDLTEEVSKVSVYRHMNGQVRYALVWYRTHRGAAMARRRLLPERATLFENVEVSIDWAHPGMTPNNVIEESGTRDENGVIQISKKEIGLYSKRNGSQRRGRDDFLDKSIKNYLQEKNTKKNLSIQRNKCSETSGRMEKPSKCVGVFAGRPKNQKSRLTHQKSLNDLKGDWNKENTCDNGGGSFPYVSQSNRENYSISGRENKKLWYPKNRDINGNVEVSKNGRVVEWENLGMSNSESPSQTLGVIARSFLPSKVLPSEVFDSYTGVPADGVASSYFQQTPRAICRDNSLPNYFQTHADFGEILESPNLPSPKCQEIGADNFGPFEIGTNGYHENDRQMINFVPKSNKSKNLTNFRAFNQITNWNGSLVPSQEDPRVVGNLSKNRGNFDTPKKHHFYPNNKIHGDHSFCQDCHDQARFFLNCFNVQRTMPVYRHGTHVFDNYFRGPSSRSSDQQKDERQHFVFPFDKVVSPNLYGTSSFSGYRVAPIYPESTPSRSILGRMSTRFDDDIHSSVGMK